MKELVIIVMPIEAAQVGEAFIPVRTRVETLDGAGWINELGVLVFRDTENADAPLEPVKILAGERNFPVPEPANDA